ncbi:CsgE family curli-type amyloid fiber assembly protein [Salinibacter altiplanensis]|uniref:CsgE family curli-type amyloid fiber assembly protein n=1 Tax=Salinibacter altiplanensis TaxID=1803181 RepID=UPI000C9F640C|nr:CsgE family curli-type amyloid fiber assembly protein [Salinibacter altiplanensis]
MNRSLVLVLGGLLLWIGHTGLASAAGPLSRPALSVLDDTVYVAEANPVVVVYEAQLDTLVVRPEGEADASIATAPPEETAPADAPQNVSGADTSTGGTRSASTSGTSPSRESARVPGSPQSRSASASASSGVKQGLSVAGLVIDRTHSVIGRDFQSVFHDHWEAPADVSNFTIRITERPLPQFGSKIQVSVGETTVFQAQLRPEYRRIEKAAQQAAARARYYLNEFHEPREVY